MDRADSRPRGPLAVKVGVTSSLVQRTSRASVALWSSSAALCEYREDSPGVSTVCERVPRCCCRTGPAGEASVLTTDSTPISYDQIYFCSSYV